MFIPTMPLWYREQVSNSLTAKQNIHQSMLSVPKSKIKINFVLNVKRLKAF